MFLDRMWKKNNTRIILKDSINSENTAQMRSKIRLVETDFLIKSSLFTLKPNKYAICNTLRFYDFRYDFCV